MANKYERTYTIKWNSDSSNVLKAIKNISDSIKQINGTTIDINIGKNLQSKIAEISKLATELERVAKATNGLSNINLNIGGTKIQSNITNTLNSQANAVNNFGNTVTSVIGRISNDVRTLRSATTVTNMTPEGNLSTSVTHTTRTANGGRISSTTYSDGSSRFVGTVNSIPTAGTRLDVNALGLDTAVKDAQAFVEQVDSALSKLSGSENSSYSVKDNIVTTTINDLDNKVKIVTQWQQDIDGIFKPISEKTSGILNQVTKVPVQPTQIQTVFDTALYNLDNVSAINTSAYEFGKRFEASATKQGMVGTYRTSQNGETIVTSLKNTADEYVDMVKWIVDANNQWIPIQEEFRSLHPEALSKYKSSVRWTPQSLNLSGAINSYQDLRTALGNTFAQIDGVELGGLKEAGNNKFHAVIQDSKNRVTETVELVKDVNGVWHSFTKSIQDLQGIVGLKNSHYNIQDLTGQATISGKAIDVMGAIKGTVSANGGLFLNNISTNDTQSQINASITDQESGITRLITLTQAYNNEWVLTGEKIGLVNKPLSQVKSSVLEVGKIFATMFTATQMMSYIRQGINEVRELDSVLVEMQQVSNESTEAINKFADSTYKMAGRIGSTAKDIQKSAVDYMRLGYSVEEASNLVEVTTKYSNVSGSNMAEATTNLISGIKAFKDSFGGDEMKTAERIADIYTEIGNNYAISASEIGSALSKSAAALTAANNDVYESVGLITAGNVIQQDADSVGNAMKVLSLRIRGAKSELQDMGEDTEGVVKSTSKLRQNILDMTGVDIMIDENTYKSTAQIIMDLSKAWDSLSDVQQASLLETLAGKTRASVVAGLIQNADVINSVIQDAKNSTGEIDKVNEDYLKGIEAHINNLQNAWQEFWQAAINRGEINAILDVLNVLLSVLTVVGGKWTIVLGLFGKQFANVFNSEALKGLSVFEKGLKSLEGALDSFSGKILIFTGIITFAKALDDLMKVEEKQKAETENLISSYEEAEQKVASLNSQIDSQKKRIDELNALPTRTYVEDKELEKLRESTELLERQRASESQGASSKLNSATASAYNTVVGTSGLSYTQWAQAFGADTNSLGFKLYDIGKGIPVLGGWVDTQISGKVKENGFNTDYLSNLKTFNALANSSNGLTVDQRAVIDTFIDDAQKYGEILTSSNSQYQRELGQQLLDEVYKFYNITGEQADVMNGIIRSYLEKNTQNLSEQEIDQATSIFSDVLNQDEKLREKLSTFSQSDWDNYLQGFGNANDFVSQLLNIVSRYEKVDSKKGIADFWNSVFTGNRVRTGEQGEVFNKYLHSLVDSGGEKYPLPYPEQLRNIDSFFQFKPDINKDAITPGKKDFMQASQQVSDEYENLYTEAFTNIALSLNKEMVEAAKKEFEKNPDYHFSDTEVFKQLLRDRYNNFLNAIGVSEKYGLGEEDANYVETATENYTNVKNALSALSSAYDSYVSNGYLEGEQLSKLISEYPEYIQYLVDEEGQINLNAEALQNLERERLNSISIAKQKEMLDLLTKALDGDTASLNKATESLAGLTGQMGAGIATKDIQSVIQALQDTGQITEEQATAFENWFNTMANLPSQAVVSNFSQVQKAVKEANDGLTESINAYSKLKSVQDTYNDTGKITASQFQELVGSYPEYLQYLIDEDGNLKLTEEALKELIKARVANYIQAMKQQDIDAIESLQTKEQVEQYKNKIEQLYNMGEAYKYVSEQALSSALAQKISEGLLTEDEANQIFSNIRDKWNDLDNLANNINYDDITGSSTSSSSTSSVKPYEKDEELYDYLDAWLKDKESIISEFEDGLKSLNTKITDALDKGDIALAQTLKGQYMQKSEGYRDFLSASAKEARAKITSAMGELGRIDSTYSGWNVGDLTESNILSGTQRLNQRIVEAENAKIDLENSGYEADSNEIKASEQVISNLEKEKELFGSITSNIQAFNKAVGSENGFGEWAEKYNEQLKAEKQLVLDFYDSLISRQNLEVELLSAKYDSTDAGAYQKREDLYVGMLENIHNAAEELRAKGVGENDKAMLELKKQYEDTFDSAMANMSEFYNELVARNNDMIAVLGVKTSVANISTERDLRVGNLNSIHAEAQKYRDNGYSENSKEILQLRSQWADEYARIFELDNKLYEQRGNITKSLIDDLSHLNNLIRDDDIDYYTKKQDIANKTMSAYASLIVDTKNQMGYLTEQYGNQEIATDLYNDKMLELSDTLQGAVESLHDYTKEIEANNLAMIEDAEDVASKLQSAYENIIDKQLENAKKEQDIQKELIDSRKQALDDLEDEYQRKWDLEDADKARQDKAKQRLDLVQQRALLTSAASTGDLSAISKLNDLDEQINDLDAEIQEDAISQYREGVKNALDDAKDELAKQTDILSNAYDLMSIEAEERKKNSRQWVENIMRNYGASGEFTIDGKKYTIGSLLVEYERENGSILTATQDKNLSDTVDIINRITNGDGSFIGKALDYALNTADTEAQTHYANKVVKQEVENLGSVIDNSLGTNYLTKEDFSTLSDSIGGYTKQLEEVVSSMIENANSNPIIHSEIGSLITVEGNLDNSVVPDVQRVALQTQNAFASGLASMLKMVGVNGTIIPK